MPKEKIKITPEHVLAIHNIVDKFGSQKDLAEFLGVTSCNVSLWYRGVQMIPIRQVEKILSKFPDDFDFLEIRPDIKRFAKYFNTDVDV